jgi:hypothetical protein
MAPHGPSRICKPLFRKEMLVGAVGIEPTTFGLKERLGHSSSSGL